MRHFRSRLLVGCVLLSWVSALTLRAQESSSSPASSLAQADAAYRAGLAALARRDLKAARIRFAETVHLAPRAEQGHSALGAVLVQLGQPAAGIKELEKALAIDAADTTAQMNLAVGCEQTGAGAKALPLFAKAEAAMAAKSQSMPGYVLASYARALAGAGDAASALARMKQAAAAEPMNPEILDQLGTLYAQQQDWPQAEQAYDDSLKAEPKYALAHLHRGMVLKAEQKSGAAEELLAAHDLAPDNQALAITAGKGLAELGQDKDAERVFREILKAAPNSSAAAYQLALILQRTDRVAEALPLFQSVIAAEPKNAGALVNLGMALCQVQQAKDGAPLLQRAIALDPNNPTAHQDLAAAYIQLNQMDDAIGELKAALKLDSESPQLHYNLGLAYKMQDDAEHAIPELQTAQKLNPAAAEPAYILGLLYMQTGRYAEAAPELEASLKLQPENGDGWATLGSVYNHLEKLPEAALALREATRQLPGKPDPHLTLATVLVKQNQTAEAAAERKIGADLMRSNMNRQRAEVATNSGKTLLAGGKIDEAIVEFRKALGFDAQYAEAHLELASALDKQGKVAEAAAERQQATALTKGGP